jgi:hypothetical protein
MFLMLEQLQDDITGISSKIDNLNTEFFTQVFTDVIKAEIPKPYFEA